MISSYSISQNIIVDGVSLVNSGGGPSNCVANGYKLKGTAINNGGCVSLTQNTFDAGALWVCDPINLNQSFKVYFEVNFDAFWDVSTPALGTINDISCDHATILVDGNQTTGGTLAGPSCLLPVNVNVTDGQFHDVCLIWDVANLEYSVYFDSARPLHNCPSSDKKSFKSSF